jgi:hypothetical protein
VPSRATPATEPRGNQPADCRVADLKRIGTIGPGLDWSEQHNLLAIARYDKSKTSQIYTLRPDGSGERCITCTEVSGAPPVNVHKGLPHWHASGDFFILQAERANHPGGRDMSHPGRGRHNEIWAATPDGERWWQLTDLSKNREGGTLFPVPSPDGRKLAWAERYAAASAPFKTLGSLIAGNPTKEVWGRWRMKIADLEYSRSSGPRLRNVKEYQPGDAAFYEMQAWTRDGRSILFAAEIGRESPYVLDIWKFDPPSGRLTAITDTNDHWEEHISFSPDGAKLAIMSSECCEWKPKDLRTLVADLYLMDADGSDKVRLTHFNTPGYPESSKDRSIVTKMAWSPDGRQIVFGRGLIGNFEESGQLWMLTFRGPCGG